MPAPQVTSARSPFAGCTILIAATAVMVFLVGFSVWNLFRLDKELAKFTSPTAKPVPLAKLEGNEAQLNDLMARLKVFETDLGAEPARECRLALSADDLNASIAAFDAFKDLRHTLHVRAVESDHLLIDISFPMNARPFSGDSRFLNATMVAVPELMQGEVILRVNALQVPDATVPPEFLGQFSPYRVTERYHNDPVLGPAMRKLTGLEIQDGKLVVRAIPGETPPHSTPDGAMQAGGGRILKWIATAACLFLVFAGTVVFIGLRKAAARAKLHPPDEPRL
jgi:hypothetical protein